MMVLDGPIHGVTFQAYVEQVLVPELKPAGIVIVDNLGRAHSPLGGMVIRIGSVRYQCSRSRRRRSHSMRTIGSFLRVGSLVAAEDSGGVSRSARLASVSSATYSSCLPRRALAGNAGLASSRPR